MRGDEPPRPPFDFSEREAAAPGHPPPKSDGPQDDNERLLNLQRGYLSGDKAAWGGLWTLSVEVARRLVMAERKKGGFFVGDVEDKAMDAVEYVLRRYSTRAGWYVKKNFISALKQGVRHALYHRTKAERCWNEAERIARGGIPVGEALLLAKAAIESEARERTKGRTRRACGAGNKKREESE